MRKSSCPACGRRNDSFCRAIVSSAGKFQQADSNKLWQRQREQLPEVPNSQDEDGGGEDLDAEADAEAAAGADAEGEPAETPAVIKKIQ